MPANRVIPGTPAEDVPATDQLVRKRLGILEDFPLHRGIEGLGQSIIRTGSN